jgi:uncharacterized protein (DUF2267 family)
MDYVQLLESVELMAGLDRDGAERAAAATLAVLAERLGRRAADKLASALPGKLRESLADAPQVAEPFDADEFVWRLANRLQVHSLEARQQASAVLATLREDVVAVDRLRDRLPADFQPLFA